MKIDGEYQKLVSEIQSLKKTVNSEKIAHQMTADQLHASCVLNQQLQTFIKSQTHTISQLSVQLTDKNRKLQEMSVGYENQLMELKQFVFAKDRELQNIRGTLSVCDYDMVRLRAINELQVGHNEQLDEQNKEIQRLNKLLTQQKQQKNILSDKLQHTKKQLQKQIDFSKVESEQRQKINSKENSKLREKLEMEKLAKKELERLLQTAKQKYQQMLSSKLELSIDKENADNKLQNFKNQIDDQSQTNTKIRRLEENIMEKNREIESLKRKMEKQEMRSQQTISNLQIELKEAKNNTLNCDDLLKKIKEKENEIQEMSNSYERKFRNQKQEFNEILKQQNKEQQSKIEQMKMKAKAEKEIQNQVTNVCSIEQTQKIYQHFQNRERQRIRTMQEKMKLLEQKNAELTQQTRNWNRRTEKAVSLREGKQMGRTDLLKSKLDEANRQIVNLLKEKVELKKQISELKH